MKLKVLFGVVLMSCSLPGTAYLATDNDKLSYSLGSRLAEHIRIFDGINHKALSMEMMDSLEGQKLLECFIFLLIWLTAARAFPESLAQMKP